MNNTINNILFLRGFNTSFYRMKQALLILFAFFNILLFTSPKTLIAETPNPFKINGNIGLFYDGYNYSHENYDNFRPKYPEHLLRFSAHTTLSAGRHFTMPIGIDITNRQVSYVLPTLPEERFIDYVQNPRNNVSINPRYKWAQAFLGTQVPSYSPLTTGDIPIFGAGVHLNPGIFIFSFNYGRSQAAINASPFDNIEGAFEQRILSSRIGIGKEDGTKFVIQLVRLSDLLGSIPENEANPTPRQGLTLSPLLQIKIGESIYFKSETAGSVFTRNLLNNELPLGIDFIDQVSNIITLNSSSNADFSNITSLEWRSDALMLGGEVRYIGPGFQSMGYRTMERDLIDYNLKTNLKLFNNNVIFSGTTGIRTNNLRNTTLESTNRFIANVNLHTRFSDVLSLNTGYSNFGFRNNVVFDTLKVEMIQNSFTINPTAQFESTSIKHIVNAGASYQFFDEYSYFNDATISTLSNSYNLNYNMVFSTTPLMLGVMGLYLENETPATQINLYNIGFNARYRMLDKKLNPAVQFSFSGITRNEHTPDNRIRLNLRTEYKITPKLVTKLAYIWSNYRYGSSRPDAITNEHRLQFSIGQRF
ncbi:MAG: hypothetical protein K9G70_08155 [Prolixibacteraceae bacterium]|nr:hypothetical protein [Prolixibacteraceae bacterium]